jgi:hypothetical protein
MKNSQIVKILRTFSKAEIKSFGIFVNSPFFNTSEATVKLLGAINRFFPDFSGADFTKQKLFAQVYGKRKYSNELFNKLISNLIKLSLEFIAVNNHSTKQHSLLRGLRKKKLENLFRSKYKKISGEFESENLNEGDILSQILVNLENSNLYLDIDDYYRFDISNKRNMELNTLHFLERLAAIYIEKTNVAITPESESSNIVQRLNENIDYENLYEQISNSNLYYKKRLLHFLSMILLHKTRNERLYHEIKASLFDTPLEDTDIINLGYIYLLDYITFRIKAGDDSFLHERHLVYKKIEHESFASGNVKIIFTFFRNFILSGINTGDFEWSKYVLNKYIHEIEGKGNLGIEYYFRSLISFHEGNFEEALRQINKLDLKKMTVDTFSFFFDIRFLKFKIYFELNYIEESLGMIDSFEHSLKKDTRINKSLQPAYKGFVKYYKKLVQCRIKEDYSGIAEITERIISERVNEKKWLLKKAGELISM